jgi:hypothetical protein
LLSHPLVTVSLVDDRVVDLTNDLELTLLLLDDTEAWRQRLVEQVSVGAPRAQVRSAYQIELPPELVEPYVTPETATVKVLVPLTTKPKRLLVRFDLEASGRPAHLLTRSDIAVIEAEYIGSAVRTSRSEPVRDLFDVDLVTALCLFTPGMAGDLAPRGRLDEVRYRLFLEEGLGFDVSQEAFSRWRTTERATASLVLEALDEPPDPISSAEQILLAMSFMERPPRDVSRVDAVLERWRGFIEALSVAGDTYVLSLLGEYGRRWEMVVETELPLNEPTTIKVSEDRDLEIGFWGTCVHDISLGDAVSYHAEVTTADGHLEFVGKPVVRGLADDAELGRPPIEGVVLERHAIAVYSSRRDRPYYARLQYRLRPTADLRVATWAVVALVMSALGVALWLDGPRAGVSDRMGILATATTFAVALLLIRESSPLAFRLLWRSRSLVLLGTGALWVTVLLRVTGWRGF